jgi:simple sugar transport system substrate-binding protein
MKDGTVTLGSFGTGVDAGTRTLIETKKAEIIAGTFAPFTGPINKQDGSEWLKAGQTADIGFLLGQMTFFVEGVKGSDKG